MRFALLVGLLAVAACADKPSEKQCRDLLDHVIKLEYEAAGDEPDKDRLQKAKAQLSTYVEDDFMQQCLDELPKKRVVCGLAARSKDELLACDDDQSE